MDEIKQWESAIYGSTELTRCFSDWFIGSDAQATVVTWNSASMNISYVERGVADSSSFSIQLWLEYYENIKKVVDEGK